MSLAQAIMHLYPGALESRQVTLIRDENGHRINYFDPALGTEPTQAELDAAEIAYKPPSILEGGDREPDLADIESNLRKAYDFFRWRVRQKIKSVYSRYQFSEVIRDDSGSLVEVPFPESSAKYVGVQGSPFGAIAEILTAWESQVWSYLQLAWSEIDPRGDFTGFDGVTPPTWSQLENDLDTLFPEP